MLDVAAAFICRGDKFLICKRPEGKPRGSLWEFPGGKLEQGETPKAALARECMEELDMPVRVGRTLAVAEHSYPEISIRLFLVKCEYIGCEPRLIEHCDARWISWRELPDFEFCEAYPIARRRRNITKSTIKRVPLAGRHFVSMQFRCRFVAS